MRPTSAEQDGFDPDQRGNTVVVGVNHKGEPYILEGNTRVAVASQLGEPFVKTEVRYWNGGEMVQGPFIPQAVASQASAPIVAEGRAAAQTINNPMRISPRRPTAVSATEDPMSDTPLQIGSDAIPNSTLGPKLMPKVMNYLGVKGERQLGDNRTDEQIFIDHLKKNLLPV